MSRTISGVSRLGAGLWLAFAILLAAFALHTDLTGEGLRGTLLFKSTGYAVYPVFYGSVAYLAFRFTKLLFRGDDYLTTDGRFIRVGDKELPIDGLRIEVRRTFLGLCELDFIRNGRREFGVKSYFLSRPIAQVVAELNSVLTPKEANGAAQ